MYNHGVKRRTTIEIDQDLLDRAKEVLGTTGLRATVHAALDEVVKARLRTDLADRLADPDGFDWDALREARERWAD
jgi:Arc/MetJ family transcription regulator